MRLPMRAARRLTWFEVRRNDVLWLFPLVAVGVALAFSSIAEEPAVFWAEASVAWRNALYVLGPWCGAVAAWSAGREHWSGMEELLTTTSRPPLQRHLAVWAGTSLLGIGSYMVVGGWIALLAAERNSWHGPYWGPILVGMAGIPLFAAIGVAWGAWKPRRATPFAAMLTFILVQLILADRLSWIAFLTPVPKVERSPWLGVSPDLPGLQLLFFAAIIGLAFALIARQSSPGWRSKIGIAGCSAVALLAAIGLAQEVPATPAQAAGSSTNLPLTGLMSDAGAPSIGSYQPVCATGTVTVCLHPALSPALGLVSEQVESMLAPLSGLDGVPVHVELVPVPAISNAPGAISLQLGGEAPREDLRGAMHDLAHALTNTYAPLPGREARQIVATWLLMESGRTISCHDGGAEDTDGPGSSIEAPVDCAAVARFAALDPIVRQQWLRDHWTAIRAGQITQEDLP